MSQNEYYCRIDGEVVGPVTYRAVKTMAAVGELLATDEIQRGADGSWQPAKSVGGLLFAATTRKSKPQALEDKSQPRTVYKMVQVPPRIVVEGGKQKGYEAALFLEELVNRYARQGWDFYRVDTIGVTTPPGCLGAILGQKEVTVQYYVVTFRRQAQ
jgi:hypothetical protein